ncbi:dipeptidase [Desulfohalovibrio reitneri]|uniref:dipeptidase n=1 Tax=Desulfohalovibrio reitneri TaxID=1307759 RepID=UPI00068D64D4|nr:C69 family dipeptidase [Desulfohalovibrio reitneri]
MAGVRPVFLSAAVCAVLLAAGGALACTTTIVGKDASADGSVLVSHSEDGLGDPRLVYVPARDHEPGSMRKVYYSESAKGYEKRFGADPAIRLNIEGRSPYYKAGEDVPPSRPLGEIPQVEHTYAYFDGNYGVMNEHQLVMGECTDKAKVHPEPEPGKRIFYSAELSRVALERCKKAREAVLLMGRLIEKYGYYGTGETLLVGDPDEAWVMEMCGYDMDGTGGVWVARRVPDGHFFAAANQFRIRDIEKDDPDLLYSENIFDIAREKGWWKPEDGPLDWARVFGDGEFHHPYYSLRRVWRAMSLAAPSLDLPAWVEGPFTRTYPFSIEPDEKMDVADVMRIHRDNYEGTEFDLTKGVAAGPFGNPNRFEGGEESAMATEEGPDVQGAFERPLNIYRCVYSYVCQARSWLPDAIGGMAWFGADRPATTVVMPFHAGINDLPESLQKGHPLTFDRESMWTTFNYMANFVMLKYDRMVRDLTEKRKEFETGFFGGQEPVEDKALALWKDGKRAQAKKFLTEYAGKNAEKVRTAWWKLNEDLYVKYNDGYLNTPRGLAQPLFYPDWWLKKAGYTDGPLTYTKPGE